MVPIDGEVREGVGLLGSPSFEIPRTVERDAKFAHLASGEERRRRLAAKNRHNLVTLGLHLLARWFHAFVLTVVLASVVSLQSSFGPLVMALVPAVFILPFALFYSVLVERAGRGFRPVQPTYCSIYQIDFWRVERFFKNHAGAHMVLNGTPFKSVIWRLLGVRLGRRLYDDGCGMAEKNLVAIGDDVTLNAGSNIQCHSQEDYAFKSDRITIGSGCTIGVGAMVHYGVTMGDGAVLAPDSFLMKGEEVPPHTSVGRQPGRSSFPGTAPVGLPGPTSRRRPSGPGPTLRAPRGGRAARPGAPAAAVRAGRGALQGREVAQRHRGRAPALPRVTAGRSQRRGEGAGRARRRCAGPAGTRALPCSGWTASTGTSGTRAGSTASCSAGSGGRTSGW